MTEEKKERLVYRVCPCFSHDIEGIQTWLEDLAMEGLFLVPEGRTLSVFSFRREAPRKVRYRMEAVGPQGLWSAADGPDREMREAFAQMGWEYLVYFGSFHIYRCADPQAPELNTDPAVQALTLSTLKKDQRSSAVTSVLNTLILILLRDSSGVFLWRFAVTAGPVLPLSVIGIFLWGFLTSLWAALRLRRYQKRLQRGESLTQRKEWRVAAHLARCARLLPGVLILSAIVSFCVFGAKSSNRLPIEQRQDPLPFVTLAEIFPEADILHESSFGDYNTYVVYDTAFSANYEWDEYGYVTMPDGTYFCIAMLEYHDTAAPWLAKHTARDYYRYEQRRYNGKRFEEEIPPDTAFDTLYVFRSYGILHIVGQEGRQAFHATVQFEDPNDQPCWELWLRAMEAKLCG